MKLQWILGKLGWAGVDMTRRAEECGKLRASVNTVMNFLVA